MFLAIFMLPESPKYFYSKQRFEEARESLDFIRKCNGLEPMESFLFDNEVETDEQITKRHQMESAKRDEEQE